MNIKYKQVTLGYIVLLICISSIRIFKHCFMSHKILKNDKIQNVITFVNKDRVEHNYTLKLVEDRYDFKQCFKLSFKSRSIEELMNVSLLIDIGRMMRQNTSILKSGEMWNDTAYSRPCSQFATLPFFLGRTGNQMFQTASLLGLAYKYDAIPIIPSWLPLRKYFDLPNIVDTKKYQLHNTVNCITGKPAFYYNCSKEFSFQANISVHGHMESWKYFAEIGDIIRAVFKFKPRHILNAKLFLSNVSIQGFQRVCIHVRRGDMISEPIKKKGFLVADRDYIDRAKRIFINKYKRVQFLVVSDDKEWCKKNLKDVIISSLTDPGDEMALMTLSDHVIVTVGTFGWWGAWLSGGTTVYLKSFAKPGSKYASGINMEDLFPSSWIGLT